MEINPIYATIGSVFEQNFLFEVPKYQRYYAWDDEQISDYINDIGMLYRAYKDKKELEHFFGGIVCVKKTIDGSNRQQRELIDGQQRITTTHLLVINIIKEYKNLIVPTNKEIVENRIDKLIKKYIEYNDEINRKPVKVHKLVLSNADRDFFISIIEDKIIPETRESHSKLKKAYIKIGKFVQKLLKECKTKDDKIDCLADLENIIHKNCSIIFIDTDSRDAAYKLFQVLNDRGTGLTAGDLLKSRTLESLEKSYQSKQAIVEKSWDEILQEGTNYAENFLRTFFASVYGIRAGRATLYDDFLKLIFPNLITNAIIKEENEAEHLVATIGSILIEYRKYVQLVNGEWPYATKQPLTEWDRRRLYVLVNFLDYDIVMPLLLAATKLEQKIFAQLVHVLEKFMFRYKGITNNSHQKISAIFMAEAAKIRNSSNYSLKPFLRTLQEYIDSDASDLVFSAAISELKYKQSGGNKLLRYFFCTLNEYYDWFIAGKKGKPTPKKILMDYENTTIEHIAAQNGNKVLGSIDINKIQNLTILTHAENDSAANTDFLAKKVILTNSEYELNKKFKAISTWDPNTSKQWLDFIIEMATSIFVI